MYSRINKSSLQDSRSVLQNALCDSPDFFYFDPVRFELSQKLHKQNRMERLSGCSACGGGSNVAQKEACPGCKRMDYRITYGPFTLPVNPIVHQLNTLAVSVYGWRVLRARRFDVVAAVP